MKEARLRKKLAEIMKEQDFEPDGEPWPVKTSKDNYKEIIQNGYFNGQTAGLKLASRSDLDYDFLAETSSLNVQYLLLVGDRKDVILLPDPTLAHCDLLSDVDFVWRIYERPMGHRPIPMERFSEAFGEVELAKVRQIAETYWRTDQILQELTRVCDLEVRRERTSATEYFVERFRRWDQKHKEANLDKRDWADHSNEFQRWSKSSIIGNFFRFADLDLPMHYCWNLLGNTDFLETEDNTLYQMNGRLELKPVGFAPAAFCWNVGLYNYKHFKRDGSAEVLRTTPKEIEVAKIFIETCPYDRKKYREAIKANLFERLYAALQVDTWSELSPFSQMPDGDREEALIKSVANLEENLLYVSNVI